MHTISNSMFRDNVRDSHQIPVTPIITKIVDCGAFQRLRYIRQMGLSSYVFQTAEHSRFSHSLGVYATARETFTTLAQRVEPNIAFPAMRFDEQAELEFCIAAMCHDLGHTAFSHVLEGNLLPRSFENHEDCTLEILRTDPELREVIDGEVDMDAVMLLIRGRHANRALSHLVSGVFDLDRCDYLFRDSSNAGVKYGQFDFAWLLHALQISFNSLGQPVLVFDGARGLEALRQFLAARHHMYKQVYFQHTIRAGEILLKSIFERISGEGVPSTFLQKVPKGLRHLVQGEPVTLDDLLITMDVEVLYLIRMLSEESGDPILRRLCLDFIRRKFPKVVLDSARSHIRLTELLPPQLRHELQPLEFDFSVEPPLPGMLPIDLGQGSDILEECKKIAAEALRAEGEVPELANYLVRPDYLPFRAYSKTGIKLRYGDEELSLDDLAEGKLRYPQVPELTENFEVYRVYAPEAAREAVREFLDSQRR